jgi:hypothetical protein
MAASCCRASAWSESSSGSPAQPFDGLHPDVFKDLTRRDRHKCTHKCAHKGLEATRPADPTSAKANSVLTPGLNDAAPDLLAGAVEHDYELRFIEQIPLDAQHGGHDDRGRHRGASSTRFAPPEGTDEHGSRPAALAGRRPPESRPSSPPSSPPSPTRSVRPATVGAAGIPGFSSPLL